MRVIILLFIASLMTVEVMCQVRTLTVIKGVVRDSVTGQPIENVNVFLSSTTLGVGTDHAGAYVLKNVPTGRYELICSRVGYALTATVVELARPDTLVRDIVLAPRLIVMGDVEVSTEAAREFQKNLAWFTRIFLGDGPNAHQCEITNPDVLTLQFDAQRGILTASADQPLIITNKALGYQLQISLAEFHWDMRADFGYYLVYPQFTSLAMENRSDSLLWKENRVRTFTGSFQHFLRALVNGTVEPEGFVVYKGELGELQEGHGTHVYPEALQPEALPGSSLTRWTFSGWLKVNRMRERDAHASYIALELSGALLDHHGVLQNPLSVRLLGSWSRERVADMLPIDLPIAGH